MPDLVAPWDQRVKELAAAKEQELKATGINFDMPEQGVRQGGEAGPAVFHVLPSPPKVRIKLEIDPDQVAEKAQAALWLPTRAQRIGDALNCRPKPCEFPLVDAGLYSLDVLADEKTVKGIVVEAEPPETVFKHQIT